VLVGAAVLVACTADSPTSPTLILPNQDAPSQEPAGGDFGADLPCEAAVVLHEHCSACHAGTVAIAPRMESRADLIADWSQAGMTVADAALASMRGTLSAMPPSGLLPDSEVAPFAAWIEAGMPAGECGSLGGPAAAELVCSSGVYRTGGDDDGEEMYPGRACISCHLTEEPGETPRFAFAGTVYPTVREPDGCVGKGGAVVHLRDAQGRSWQLPTKPASGNFMLEAPSDGVAFPVTASVSVGDASIEMTQPLASAIDGDCNRCHTQDGAEGAHGRIFSP